MSAAVALLQFRFGKGRERPETFSRPFEPPALAIHYGPALSGQAVRSTQEAPMFEKHRGFCLELAHLYLASELRI
jgi:hypothetical protein